MAEAGSRSPAPAQPATWGLGLAQPRRGNPGRAPRTLPTLTLEDGLTRVLEMEPALPPGVYSVSAPVRGDELKSEPHLERPGKPGSTRGVFWS